MKTVTQEDIRAIHSRLDVHKKVIGTAIGYLSIELGRQSTMVLLDMLEESQNPFEVSDEHRKEIQD